MDDDLFDNLLTTKTMDDKLQFTISLFSSIPSKLQVTNALSSSAELSQKHGFIPKGQCVNNAVYFFKSSSG